MLLFLLPSNDENYPKVEKFCHYIRLKGERKYFLKSVQTSGIVLDENF